MTMMRGGGRCPHLMNSSHAAASEIEVGAHCRSASEEDFSSFSTSIIVDA